jgi:hypothetical protein
VVATPPECVATFTRNDSGMVGGADVVNAAKAAHIAATLVCVVLPFMAAQ